MKCPDCNGSGTYQPLFGSLETCSTCKGTGGESADRGPDHSGGGLYPDERAEDHTDHLLKERLRKGDELSDKLFNDGKPVTAVFDNAPTVVGTVEDVDTFLDRLVSIKVQVPGNSNLTDCSLAIRILDHDTSALLWSRFAFQQKADARTAQLGGVNEDDFLRELCNMHVYVFNLKGEAVIGYVIQIDRDHTSCIKTIQVRPASRKACSFPFSEILSITKAADGSLFWKAP